MLKTIISALAAGLFTLGMASQAMANDPGTNVNACFKFQNLPSTDGDDSKSVDYKFTFTVAGADAFDESGQTTVSFSFDDKDDFASPDVQPHCQSMGYYECSNSSCTMTMSYTVDVPSGKTPVTPYMGTISLTWWSDGGWFWDSDNNHISSGNASTADSPVICGSAVPCTGTDYTWAEGTVGDLYVIFQPSGN